LKIRNCYFSQWAGRRKACERDRVAEPFLAYAQRDRDSYQGWRSKAWDEERLRRFLAGLRVEDKALLKILADRGSALQQHGIMEALPFLHGRNSASLRALKAHINGGCSRYRSTRNVFPSECAVWSNYHQNSSTCLSRCLRYRIGIKFDLP
jgi:hypothetical protein